MGGRASAHEAFRKCFGVNEYGEVNGNFMTPTVLERRMVGPYAVEISEGTGFDNDPIYGVTVLLADGTRPEDDLSRMFSDWREAYAYAKGLQ